MLSRRYLKLRTVQAAFRILEEEGINEEDGERRVVTLFFPPERIALEMASRGEALFIYCIVSIMSIMYYIFHGGSIALIRFISMTHCICRHGSANENDPGETGESYTGPYDLVLLHLEAKLDLGGSFYMLVLTPLVSLDDHSATRPSDPTNMSAFPEQWAVANNGDGGLRRHGRPGVHRRQLFSNPVQLKH